MPDKVEFESRRITLRGELYRPEHSAPNRKRAAIVIGHPMGGVKEQTAAMHAKRFAEEGFFALTFDAAYQGQSRGQPRNLEDPTQRAEDVRAAVTYLSLVPEVDPERIGALGICASGGYVPYAAQTDLRIKAVATVSAADVGSLFREGLKGTEMKIDRNALQKTLRLAGEARLAEAKGEQPPCIPIVPDDPEKVTEGTPDMFREGSEYYRTERGNHPRSNNRFLLRSCDLMVNYSSYAFIDLISPRPLLMIAGADADTRYFSEDAVARARDPKELFIVPGKTHVDLYDDLSVSFPKLLKFMTKFLTH